MRGYCIFLRLVNGLIIPLSLTFFAYVPPLVDPDFTFDRSFIAALVLLTSVLTIYVMRREMKLHYIQNNPDEDDRHFVIFGFKNRWVREDYVYAYPHAWVRRTYRMVILILFLAIAWFFIRDMIII